MFIFLFLYTICFLDMTGKIPFIIACFIFILTAVFPADGQKAGYSDEALLAEAVTKYDSGDMGGAHKILKELIERDPGNDAALYYMGLVRYAYGNVKGAESSIKQAIAIDPDNFWYPCRLAMLYVNTERAELAVSIYERLLKDFPAKTDLYYTLIDLYVRLGRYEDALSTLSLIETVFGETDMTAYARFDLCRMAGRPQDGYRYLKAYNAQHASVQISTLLGDYYISRYDKDSAMVMYKEALGLEENYAPALLGLASIYRHDGDYGEYFECVDRFLSDPYVPTDTKSRYINEAFSPNDPYFLEAFKTEIDSLMADVLSSNPGDTLVTASVAYYYFFTRRTDRALELFKENTDLSPDSRGTWSDYLVALYALQDWPAFYEVSAQAAERFAADPYFIEQRGIACMMLEDYDEALERFESLVAIMPDDTAAVAGSYAIMGDIYHQMGETKAGNSCYEKSLRFDPDNPVVLNNYAYFLSMTGKNLRKAAEMGRKCVDAEPDNPTYLDTYGWILHLMGRSYEAKDLFRHAMLYGGRENAVILDHYAEILYSLGDKDMAMHYWGMALEKDALSAPAERIPGLKDKVAYYKSIDE